MRIYLFVFSLMITTLSQTKTVTIHTVDMGEKLSGFEASFINQFTLLVKKKDNSLKFQTITHRSHAEMFQFLKTSEKNDKDTDIYLGYLSATPDRMKIYDFSVPYLRSGKAILSKAEHSNLKLENNDIVYLEGTNDKRFIEIVKSKFSMKPIPVEENQKKFDMIEANQIKFITADVASAWTHNLEIRYTEIREEFGDYCILFNKGSSLKSTIDPIVKYIVSSPNYYKLIRQHFGSKAVEFYKTLK